MSELHSQERFFDEDLYITDERNLIPQKFGKQIGDFCLHVAYIAVEINSRSVVYDYDGYASDFQSLDYALDDPEYIEEFKYWKLSRDSQGKFAGHLAGFPVIKDENGKKNCCMHIWANNSDTLGSSFAVPLVGIEYLGQYPKQRARLEIELDELAFGDVDSRIQLPTYRDSMTGELEYAPASSNEIEHLINMHYDTAKTIYRRPPHPLVVPVQGDLTMQVL